MRARTYVRNAEKHLLIGHPHMRSISCRAGHKKVANVILIITDNHLEKYNSI